MQTQSGSSSYQGSGISESSKYNGMIAISKTKIIRNYLFVMFFYIDQVVPSMNVVHSVISYIRLFQFYLPSMCLDSNLIYAQGTLTESSFGILRRIFYFSGQENSSKTLLYIIFINFLAFSLSFCVMVISSFSYHSEAKLSKLLSIIYKVIISTYYYLSTPLVSYFSAELLCNIIENEFSIINIMGIIMGFLHIFMIHSIQKNILGISVQFRPDSLASADNKRVVNLTIITAIPTFLNHYGSHQNRDFEIALYLICAIIYGYIFFVFYEGTPLINHDELVFLLSLCLSGILNLILHFLMGFFGYQAKDSHLFIIIGIFAFSYLMCRFLVQIHRNKQIELLDYIENNGINENHNLSSVIGSSITGFSLLHPLCINWGIFMKMIEKWDDNPEVYLTYAKFASIYPDESQTLDWIRKQIVVHRFKGSECKLSVLQIMSILRQRETNLSPYLKRKINSVTKLINQCKQRMRNIWDTVIQSNIGEMESVISKSHNSMKKTEIELNHLLIQYPNNRFVAKLYYIFIKEIKADMMESCTWNENIKLLKKGLMIVPDISHEFGLKTFPNIPPFCKGSNRVLSQSDIEMSNIISENEFEEEIGIHNNDLNRFIRDRINSIVIPGVRDTYFLSTSFVIILIFIPIIFLIWNSSIFSKNIEEPLEYMYSLSEMRSLNYQLTSFGLRMVLEEFNLPDFNTTLLPTNDYDSYIPKSLLDNTTRGQVQSLSKLVPSVIQKINQLKSYQIGDIVFDNIRVLCFNQSISYQHFISPYNITRRMVSPVEMFISSSFQLMQLSTQGAFDVSTLESTLFLNPIKNVEYSDIVFEKVLNSMEEFFSLKDSEYRAYYLNMFYIYSIIIILFYSFTPYMNLMMIKEQKLSVYKCLTALPKYAVGQIIESLNSLKKNSAESTKNSSETDGSVNKQEENIMKIFNSASDNGITSVGSDIMQTICVIFIVGSGIFGFYNMVSVYLNQSAVLKVSAPQMSQIASVISSISRFFCVMHRFTLFFSNNFQTDQNPVRLFERYDSSIKTLEKSYNTFRFGEESGLSMPYNGLDPVLLETNEGIYECSDKSAITNEYHQMFHCYDADFNLMMISRLIEKQMSTFSILNISFDRNNMVISDTWFVGAILIYDKYLYPLFSSIISFMNNQISSYFDNNVFISMFCLLIASISQIIIIIAAVNMRKHLVYTLSLLLHCPLSIVTQTPKISSVLSGDFSSQNIDKTNRGELFFSSLNNNLPDGIIVISPENKTVFVNQSLKSIFNISSIMEPPSFQNFFNSDRFGPDCETLKLESFKMQGIHLTLMINGQKRNIHFISNNLPNGFILHTFREEDREISYSNLIKEERSKSDKMLSSILPASLVPRVQAGETDISFSVQSASIVFIDIVEFTPWCSTNSANRVMAVLNCIFREFDSLLSKYSTMTKIKCIGDCYMAAGGVFSEINQPSKHAKESLDFSLDCISTLHRINQEMNENLKIRIGVNSGGPIVGGVLGVGKPTFEILGSTINMAQQMEHHGIPMNVHISRTVYELVYSGKYNIKERGEIEIKNGKVITYLVTPFEDQDSLK